MKNNKKLIFIDFDGTFFDHSIKGVPESTKDALMKVKENKLADLYLTTGRTYVYLKNHLEYTKYFDGFVTANGEYVIYNNQVLFQNYLDVIVARNLAKYCLNQKISMTIYTTDLCYAMIFENDLKEEFKKEKNYPLEFIEDLKIIENLKIHQICLFTRNENLEEVENKFPTLDILKWGTYGADVIPKGISKGKAIKKIIEIGNYDYNNTYGIGDGENDITMFENVRYSIAMGNALEHVKVKALETTDEVNKDGLAKAIFKIIKK